MFFPYSTDAPVYHRPWGTVGLIALNVVVFGLVLGGHLDRATGPWPLDESVLRSLVKGFQGARGLAEAKPYILECIERFPSRATSMKLLLAKVLIEHEQRPASALEVLESIPASELLSDAQLRVRQKLEAEAIRLRDAGVLEVD